MERIKSHKGERSLWTNSELKAQYQPTGDQPQAIEALVRGFEEGQPVSDPAGRKGVRQDLHHGQRDPAALQKPTLVIAHNKTLAAQLYGEFKEIVP